jgi:hypothetical protein
LPGNQGVEVCRKKLSAVEDVELSCFVVEVDGEEGAVGIGASGLIGSQCVVAAETALLVGDGNPSGRKDDVKVEVGFEVGLVEARNEPVGRVRLKRGVGILLGRSDCAIDVHEAAQSIIVQLILVMNTDIVDSYLEVHSRNHQVLTHQPRSSIDSVDLQI